MSGHATRSRWRRQQDQAGAVVPAVRGDDLSDCLIEQPGPGHHARRLRGSLVTQRPTCCGTSGTSHPRNDHGMAGRHVLMA
jgi:hypothetical protein